MRMCAREDRNMSAIRIQIISPNPARAGGLADRLRRYRGERYDIAAAADADLGDGNGAGAPDCIVYDATDGAAETLHGLKELLLTRSDLPCVALVSDAPENDGGRALIIGAQVQLTDSSVSDDSLAVAIAAAIDAKSRERIVVRRAFRDETTGLSSRLYFMERMVTAFERSDRTGNAFAIAFLSLNGFRRIAATYGHETGDALVREVAGRLKANARASDTLARMDFDEFVVLIEDLQDDGTANAATAVERYVRSVRSAPYVLNGLRIDLEVCTGMSVYPLMGETPEELLSHAGRAMFESRRSAEILLVH